MSPIDVYIYGMTVLSTIYLVDSFPSPNDYREIRQTYAIPGGEAGNSAIVLRSLGLRVRLDGSYLGIETEAVLRQAFQARDIDCSRMPCLDGFPGWKDIVFCDGENRTIFGWFGQQLFGGERLWTVPDEDSIRQAQVVALDPFFGVESAQVADLCIKHGVEYVTIDCKCSTAIARNARAIVCSQEFLDRDYPGADYADVFEQYRATCKGLVIFTFGGRDLWYQAPTRKESSRLAPFKVKVVDTLGAGDTFRAGVAYGVLKHMPDDEIVRFASATAAMVCTRFPSVQQPPTLDEIQALMDGTGQL